MNNTYSEEQMKAEQTIYERAYADFMALDGMTRHLLVEEWNNYFKKIRTDSPRVKKYFEMKEAMNDGDTDKIKRLAKEVKVLVQTTPRIPLPSEFDPLFLVYKHKMKLREKPAKESKDEKNIREAMY